MFATTTLFALDFVGHRGASFDAPENTLASFKLGYEQNADADELDIYLTQDGKIVVSHDAGLKLYTWTVDDPAVARKQAAAGVDGLTTNRPGWLRKQLTGQE